MKHYLRIYKQLAIYNFSSLVASRLDFVTLILGKLLRMGLIFLFILGIFEAVPSLAGYSKGEVVLFFAVFDLIDLLVQIFFFRGFWFLQEYVQSGEFDKILTYPISPIFLTAFKITDWMDFMMLVPAFGLLVYAVSLIEPIGLVRAAGAALLVLTGLVVAFGFCLFLSALTFYTTRLSNVWWLYRDLAAMARFPLSIFPTLLVGVLTYLIPIGVIFNWPAKAFLGEVGLVGYVGGVVLGIGWVVLGKKFWDFSLKRYSSASS